MKSDVDRLMADRDIDALIIFGNMHDNPFMYYFTGVCGQVSNAMLFKKIGKPSVLFCNSMERDEAAKSGLDVIPIKSSIDDELFVNGRGLFESMEMISGQVAVFGIWDVGRFLKVLDHLSNILPALEFLGDEKENSLLVKAMETKEIAEIDRIRNVGLATIQIVDEVRKFLVSRDVRSDETLLKEDGAPLTVGDVHNLIKSVANDRGVDLPSGFIFSIGRDAGVPHSTGNPRDVIQLGRTILFDIYPAEKGGGYYYDFTRTWCLGYAPSNIQKIYDELKNVYDEVVENIDLNSGFKEYQKMACDLFVKSGHNTPVHTDGILTEGYVHSLGHGLGLNLHENPISRHTSSDENILRPGVVVTIEPGLYYPEQDMGFRIEDSYWMRPDGLFERLVEYPYDLVLPMEKWQP